MHYASIIIFIFIEKEGGRERFIMHKLVSTSILILPKIMEKYEENTTRA